MTLNEIYELALEKCAEHGVPGVRVELSHAKRLGGSARHGKTPNEGKIRLSGPILLQATDEDVLDTILHELAHILVGPGHGHDAVWKAKCVEIGARPIRCHKMETVKGDYLMYIEGTLEIVRHYHRRPSKDFSRLWLKGRKQETYGKLKLATTWHYEKLLRDKERENA